MWTAFARVRRHRACALLDHKEPLDTADTLSETRAPCSADRAPKAENECAACCDPAIGQTEQIKMRQRMRKGYRKWSNLAFDEAVEKFDFAKHTT